MSAHYTLVRTVDTAAPLLGVAVFAGGFEYIALKDVSDNFPDPDVIIDAQGLEDSEITPEVLQGIVEQMFNNQAVETTGWTEVRSLAAAKKALKDLLKSPSIFTSDSAANVFSQVASELSFAGATYDQEGYTVEEKTYASEGLEDLNMDDMMTQAMQMVDPDSPDAWRFKHLREFLGKTQSTD